MAPRLLVLSVVAAVTTSLSAQQGPTFRAQVELIQVDAFVTDGEGTPVTNLRLEDFELLEDGTPQTITTFSAVNIPIEAPPPFSPTAARADVATNRGRDGRFYAIAVDELDPAIALRVRHHLRTFIERHFESTDVGVVVNVGRASASGAQDVTSDRALLLAAIDRVRGWPPPFAGEPVSLPQRRRAAALKALLASLAAVPGRRKALIYLTHDVGDVFEVVDYNGGVRSLVFEDLRAAMTDAMRGGVAIYTIDPCGLAPLGGLIGEEPGETPYSKVPVCDVTIDRTMNFRLLSSATGGFAVVNSNNFGDAFERIVRENSSYYSLGYVSTNDRRDGRYRRLDVRTRQPGLTVRTRDGYIAPVPTRREARSVAATAPGIRDVMASPVANGAVPMTVFAAPFKGSKGNEALVLITAELDASRLDLAEAEGRRRGRIELAAAAVHAAGKVTRSRPEVIDLSLTAEAYAEVMTQGVRVRAPITLLPGRYQLRVAGGNIDNGRIGSVMYDLDVPDFTKGPLTMSGLAVSTTTADPTMSTVAREFARGTRLALYVEVYDNGRTRGPRTIDVTIGVRNDEGRIVQAVGDRRTRTERGTETFDVGVPLDIEPGRYVLRADATSGETTVSREIPISVR